MSLNAWQIKGATNKYDWWWHNMTGYENGDPKKPRSFFIEYFTINPGLDTENPVIGPIPRQTQKLRVELIPATQRNTVVTSLPTRVKWDGIWIFGKYKSIIRYITILFLPI